MAGSGLYVPRRKHGPRSFGPTTVRIAKFLAQLTPCRPGVAYLMRRSGLSERAVEYHLGMLREAGLLVYAVRGTRVRGQGRKASEFLRTIPPEFDGALGIRTVGDGAERRPVGIEESGRGLIGRLAKKAARKTRRKTRSTVSSKARGKAGKAGRERSAGPVRAGGRCTPMGGGTSASESTATTRLPSEAKLASGKPTSASLEKTPKRSARPLNRVGRRYQLARELTQQVPWLGRADVPRVAWVARHVADAGWTAGEVIAWLDLQVAPDRRYSPAGLLAYRLVGALATWADPRARAVAAEAQRDSRRAERERHAGWEGGWQPPRDTAVLRRIQQTLAAAEAEQAERITLTDSALPVLEDLSRDQIAEMRQQALRDPSVIAATIAMITPAHGEETAEQYARRLYSNRLVDQALGLARSQHLVLHGPRGWA